MINQLVGIGVAWALAIVGTLVALKIVDITIGLRVEEEQEVTQHGEEGYVWDLPTYDPAGDYQSSVRII